ncbi:hypothetical protein [Chitinimonas lacunae]|uniref:Uncharacterized protein n=1 Tax=Chitinimonas lacunae TaxID=1963018 RepID=A0ABV8MUM5_9NEIS
MENAEMSLWQTVSAGVIGSVLVLGMATLVAPAMRDMAPGVEQVLAKGDVPLQVASQRPAVRRS